MNNENELTAALLTIEKCRELSGCPAGVDLQDWVKQLAAENVALRAACGGDGSYRNCPACTFSEYIEAPETPATDRIVAAIKADGVALAKSAFEKHIQSTSCYQDEMVGMESALSIAYQVESQLREGADK